jgi:uncharacterized membrane protein HdeD (DUF308 family)
VIGYAGLRRGHDNPACPPPHREIAMIVLGIILLIIGFVAKVAILWTIGIVLVVIGAILAVLGTAGREIGGRKHWY